jgi:hypothetical protein
VTGEILDPECVAEIVAIGIRGRHIDPFRPRDVLVVFGCAAELDCIRDIRGKRIAEGLCIDLGCAETRFRSSAEKGEAAPCAVIEDCPVGEELLAEAEWPVCGGDSRLSWIVDAEYEGVVAPGDFGEEAECCGEAGLDGEICAGGIRIGAGGLALQGEDGQQPDK